MIKSYPQSKTLNPHTDMTYHEDTKEILLHTVKTLREIQDKMAEMVVTFKKLRVTPSNATQVNFRNDIKESQNEIDELKEDLNDTNFPPQLETPQIIDIKNALREELLRKKRFLSSFEYDLRNTEFGKPTQKKFDESLRLDIESAMLILGDEIHKSAASKKSSITESLLNFRSKLEHRLKYPQAKSLIQKKENLDHLDLNTFSDRFIDEVSEELKKIGIEVPNLKEKILQNSIKESDQLEIDERNLLWVAYPELKQIGHSALIRIQNLESFIPRTREGISENTNARILQSILKDIKKQIHSNNILIETLDESLNQAKKKTKSKNYNFDFTIDSHINLLKETINNKNKALHSFYQEILDWLN